MIDVRPVATTEQAGGAATRVARSGGDAPDARDPGRSGEARQFPDVVGVVGADGDRRRHRLDPVLFRERRDPVDPARVVCDEQIVACGVGNQGRTAVEPRKVERGGTLDRAVARRIVGVLVRLEIRQLSRLILLSLFAVRLDIKTYSQRY